MSEVKRLLTDVCPSCLFLSTFLELTVRQSTHSQVKEELIKSLAAWKKSFGSQYEFNLLVRTVGKHDPDAAPPCFGLLSISISIAVSYLYYCLQSHWLRLPVEDPDFLPLCFDLFSQMAELENMGVRFSQSSESKPSSTKIDPSEEEAIMKAIAASLDDASSNTTKTSSTTFSAVKTKASPQRVKVLYDFEAADDQELQLHAGDIIFVIDKTCVPRLSL